MLNPLVVPGWALQKYWPGQGVTPVRLKDYAKLAYDLKDKGGPNNPIVLRLPRRARLDNGPDEGC